MIDGELYKVILHGNTYIYAYCEQGGYPTSVYVCAIINNSGSIRVAFSHDGTIKRITSYTVVDVNRANDEDKQKFNEILYNNDYHYSVANKKLFLNREIIL